MAIDSVGARAGTETDARGLFEAAFDLSPAAVIVLDDERRLRAVSDTACEILARDRRVLLGHRIDAFLAPTSRERMRAAWPRALRADTRVHEIAILRPDGSQRTVVMVARANVVPGRHLVTFDDEVDHRRGDDDLERLFADSPDLLVVAGGDGYLARANPACERTLGYSQAELLSRPYIEFIHQDDRQATLSALGRLRDGESGYTLTQRMRCRDGSYSVVEWNVVRLPGQTATTAVGRVVHGSGAAGPNGGGEHWETSPSRRGLAEPREWPDEETFRGIEPSLVWAIEQQMAILDDVTRVSPEPRVAAVRCALALRQALVEMGTIVHDLRPPSTLQFPAGPAGGWQRRHGGGPPGSDRDLTDRECDVVRLVAKGHDNRMICAELFLAEVTVKKHVQHAMYKLGAASRTQLVLAAVRLGLDR